MAHIAMPTIQSVIDGNTGFIGGNTVEAVNNGSNNVPLERRCDNPDCTVYKMVTNVPKRKAPQFVTEPVVMEKPLLINGFTTIFQVEGQSAKLSDVKNPDVQRSLYRIVPNTHAHIVNYVVVDSDTESLRKINENDPATMRKLLDSQKQSADQMLKKLIAGHSVPFVNINANTVAATTMMTATPPQNTNLTPASTNITNNTIGSITPISVAKLMPQTTTPTIQLPTRVHPNLKITAVASAEGLSNLGAANPSAQQQLPSPMQLQPTPPPQQQQAPMPLITPVPLVNLQRIPVQPAVSLASHVPVLGSSNIIMPSVSPMNASSGIIGDVVEKPVFDKMQQELQELRRTVALLAEAHSKNKHN